jgi:hypothetical protein
MEARRAESGRQDREELGELGREGHQVRVVVQPSAHFGEGGGLDGAGDVLVTEGGVPPWGKTGDVGVEVACVGMKEVGLARTEDRASAEIGVDEGATDEIRAICGGIGVGGCGSGGGATRVGSSKVKRRSGKRSI